MSDPQGVRQHRWSDTQRSPTPNATLDLLMWFDQSNHFIQLNQIKWHNYIISIPSTIILVISIAEVAIIVGYYSVGLNCFVKTPTAGVMVITIYNHGYDKWEPPIDATIANPTHWSQPYQYGWRTTKTIANPKHRSQPYQYCWRTTKTQSNTIQSDTKQSNTATAKSIKS